MTPTRREVLSAVAGLVAGTPGLGRVSGQPQLESREVRQLVTFRFLPGQTQAVLDRKTMILRELAGMRVR